MRTRTRRRAAGPRKTREERLAEAYDRGRREQPNSNDVACIMELMDRGIPMDAIDTYGPRQNVWTYDAWLHQGRHVRKGEHAVRLSVWRPIDAGAPARELDDDDGPQDSKRRPRCRLVTACVFHVSQTDANDDTARGLDEFAPDRKEAARP